MVAYRHHILPHNITTFTMLMQSTKKSMPFAQWGVECIDTNTSTGIREQAEFDIGLINGRHYLLSQFTVNINLVYV